MIKLSKLTCSQGDTKIEINDTDPEERKKFAAEIVALLTKSVFIVVSTGDGKTMRISGYDAVSNEWIIHPASIPKEEVVATLPKKRGRPRKTDVVQTDSLPKKRGRPRKVSAEDSSATAVAPIAGG